MIEELFRNLFLYLSRSHWLRRAVTDIPIAYHFASRFTAGETADEAVATLCELCAGNLLCTVDILGEEVSTKDEAQRARDAYLDLLDKLYAAGTGSDISLKLTQLGLDLGLDLCVQSVGAVVARAQELAIFVCIDMEDSPRTEATLEVWRRLHAEYDNVGIVIQSYLYRSEEDVSALCEAGATVRLCKGAYKESAAVAFQEKSKVDANLIRLMRLMLDRTMAMPASERPYMAMATHDEKMIAATKAYAAELGVPREAYEFQMLYGIRRDLQDALAAEGYRMRVYVPFGAEWFPYYMRRMAERPANVWFILKTLMQESPGISAGILTALILTLLLLLRRKRR